VARVGGQGAAGSLNSPGMILGMRATYGKACSGRTRSRRRRSPGRSRREEGDDRRVPRCQRLRARRRAVGKHDRTGHVWRMRAGGDDGQKVELGCGRAHARGWRGRRRPLGWPAGPAKLHGLERVLGCCCRLLASLDGLGRIG
jgi:hypothetical protein